MQWCAASPGRHWNTLCQHLSGQLQAERGLLFLRRGQGHDIAAEAKTVGNSINGSPIRANTAAFIPSVDDEDLGPGEVVVMSYDPNEVGLKSASLLPLDGQSIEECAGP